jgi:hypothetical protein
VEEGRVVVVPYTGHDPDRLVAVESEQRRVGGSLRILGRPLVPSRRLERSLALVGRPERGRIAAKRTEPDVAEKSRVVCPDAADQDVYDQRRLSLQPTRDRSRGRGR